MRQFFLKQLSLFLVLLMLLFSCTLGYTNVQEQAFLDAHKDVDEYVSGISWLAGGFLCCLVAIYAAVDTPDVPAMRLVGKSPEYITVYTSEYQSKAKGKRVKNALIGWAVASALSTIYWAIAINAAE